MKITVVGAGYVGLSLAVLLAQRNSVKLLDVVPEKVELINDKKSPIADEEITNFLSRKNLDLTAGLDSEWAYSDAKFVIIATPTDYDPDKNYFNTKTVEQAIADCIKINPRATIVIKSTLPVGFVSQIRKKHKNSQIFFSPEFLREGKALYDNLYPSRIIVGSDTPEAKKFANLLAESAVKEDIPQLFVGATEAEAIKLFSNSYLAMRVAYFNEIDTYAEMNDLSSKNIIDGVCLDTRIGGHYNNPSFGYGGYCLPKDTKQLRANFENVPSAVIQAIIKANEVRKQHIADQIIARKPKTVGIYKLAMKHGSDNARASAIISIMLLLKKANIDVIIYDEGVKEKEFMKFPVCVDLAEFKKKADVILTNRHCKELKSVSDKVYTRDLFNRD